MIDRRLPPRASQFIRWLRKPSSFAVRPGLLLWGIRVPLIVDDSIEAQPEIYMEAGDHETLLRMSHAQFARLMRNTRHGRFSEKLPDS